MEKVYDVTALGELLIDFTENGTSVQGNPLLEANPGGAPCNVLAMLEKLGKKTAFIGKVGKDMFGEQLKTAVEEVGIDTRNLVMDEEVHTTLAFVHTYPDGDRDFSFYRNQGADMMLKKEEVEEERRMFYVAMTRARKKLIISYTKERNGKSMAQSRFVGELLTRG